jgi:hypothetical protein
MLTVMYSHCKKGMYLYTKKHRSLDTFSSPELKTQVSFSDQQNGVGSFKKATEPE